MIFNKIVITNFHKKITKIAIFVLQEKSDDKRCSQNFLKQANSEIVRQHALKTQIPTVWGLKVKYYLLSPPGNNV